MQDEVDPVVTGGVRPIAEGAVVEQIRQRRQRTVEAADGLWPPVVLGENQVEIVVVGIPQAGSSRMMNLLSSANPVLYNVLQYVNSTMAPSTNATATCGRNPADGHSLVFGAASGSGCGDLRATGTDDGFFGLIGATRASFNARSAKSVCRSVSAACRKVKKVLQADPARQHGAVA